MLLEYSRDRLVMFVHTHFYGVSIKTRQININLGFEGQIESFFGPRMLCIPAISYTISLPKRNC